MRFLLPAMLIAALLPACNAPFSYEYKIANQSDSFLTVVVRRDVDSSMIIAPHITKTIFFVSQIEKKKGGPRFHEPASFMDTIYIFQAGRPSRVNYMDGEKWSFQRTSDALGVSTATCADTDF